MGFPGGASHKEPGCQCKRCKRGRLDLQVRKIPWRKAWQPTPVFLSGESHGQRTLVGYSPWGFKESDMTEVTLHVLTAIVVLQFCASFYYTMKGIHYMICKLPFWTSLPCPHSSIRYL